MRNSCSSPEHHFEDKRRGMQLKKALCAGAEELGVWALLERAWEGDVNGGALAGFAVDAAIATERFDVGLYEEQA